MLIQKNIYCQHLLAACNIRQKGHCFKEKLYVIFTKRVASDFWTQKSSRLQSSFYNNIGNLSIRSLCYHSNDTKRNPQIMLCSHCPINNSIYTIPFTLHLWQKPLDILQRVTKSEKINTSSHDGLQNFITSNFYDIGHRVFQRRSRVAGNQIF